MSHSVDILLVYPSPARNDARDRMEGVCLAKWRLARSGDISSMSRRGRGFAAPIPSNMAERAVRVTRNTRSGIMGCGVPCRSSDSACATAKRPMPRSKRTARASLNRSMRTSAQNLSAVAAKANVGAIVTAAPAVSQCRWEVVGGPVEQRQLPAKAAISTHATGISGLVAATVHLVIAEAAPAADNLRGVRA